VLLDLGARVERLDLCGFIDDAAHNVLEHVLYTRLAQVRVDRQVVVALGDVVRPSRRASAARRPQRLVEDGDDDLHAFDAIEEAAHFLDKNVDRVEDPPLARSRRLTLGLLRAAPSHLWRRRRELLARRRLPGELAAAAAPAAAAAGLFPPPGVTSVFDGFATAFHRSTIAVATANGR
jgi:hypothetical protein